MGSLPVKYSFWTSITKSARFGFSVIKPIVGQRKKRQISVVGQYDFSISATSSPIPQT